MRAVLTGILLAGFAAAQTPKITAVTSAAFLNAPAPDSLVTIFGTGLSDGVYYAESQWFTQTGLGPTTVSFCPTRQTCPNSFVELLYASPTQINLYLPADPVAVNSTTVQYGLAQPEQFTVTVNGQAATFAVNVSPVAPSIFGLGWDCDTFVPDGDSSPCGISSTQQGPKQVMRGAITDLTGKPLSSENPAHFGQYYVIYLTGLSGDADVQAANPVTIGFQAVRLNEPGVVLADGSQGTSYAGHSSYVGLQQINFQLQGDLFGGAAPDASGQVYPPEWACGTRLEAKITVSEGTVNAPDAHGFSLPLVVEKGEIPCL